MAETNLFETMLATYPAEKRELARQVYHRFADGDGTQFFTQLFLVLDVYAHYAEHIPVRMISANADALATMQELREEVDQLAKTIKTRDVNITNNVEKTNELCRVTQARCQETIASIESTVKNLGSRVDTRAIVLGIQNTLESGIRREVISPFIQRTEQLAQEVMPALEKVRAASAEAKSYWSKRIWRTAWTACLLWSFSLMAASNIYFLFKYEAHYRHKLAEQTNAMAQVMKFNRVAFDKLTIAQVPIQVLPTQGDGFDSPPGFVLVVAGAYAADMQQANGQNNGCIFFRSSVPEDQIRHLQQDSENHAQGTNTVAK